MLALWRNVNQLPPYASLILTGDILDFFKTNAPSPYKHRKSTRLGNQRMDEIDVTAKMVQLIGV